MARVAACGKLKPTQVGRYCSAIMLLVLLINGCQARLDMSGVLSQQSQPVQRADLLQAAAAHGETIVVVGAMGIIITSDDGGTTWQRTTLDGKPFLIDVSVCPSGDFFAIDNVGALWSSASATDWSENPLPASVEPQALTCDESGALWLVGSFGTIMTSVDGGGKWKTYSLDDDVYLTTVQFVDPEHGYITGEFGTVLHTRDNGSTWQRVEDLPDNFYPQAARFIDQYTGWIVGLNGTIWYTGNGGKTWSQEDNGHNAPLYGVALVGDRLVAVGDNGTVLYRRPGEADWAQLENSVGTRTYLRGIVALSDGRFAAAGGGVLFTSALPLP